MISYKKVYKYKYTKNPADVVALREYILFEDGKKESRYALLKFCNNLDQPLYGIQFEIYQYDEAGNLLGKSLNVYDKFSADAGETFVPKAKLKLSVNCASITLKLISAEFDRVRWEKGEFAANDYKFSRYVEDIGAVKPTAPTAAPQAEATPAPAKKEKKHGPFALRNVTRQNFAKFPKVFEVLVILLVSAFVIATSVWFRYTSDAFTLEEFQLIVSPFGTATVEGYEGKETDLVIPAMIGEYRITRIKEGAFRRSSIESVTIESESCYIESRAFSGCNRLLTVESSGRVTVAEFAFENCKKLSAIRLPDGWATANSFYGSENVRRIDIGRIDCTQDELFGIEEE